MSHVQVNHIKATLDETFRGKLTVHDHDAKCEDDIDQRFYSRSLAAYALLNLASASVQDAIDSITDGYQDNGIDAIFYDDKQLILYLVQSKFIENGVGEPDNGDIRKFKDGIIDLVQERFERFNKKVNAKKEDIKLAFAESKIKLNIILVYTGKGFSPANQTVINDVIKELNDSTDWVVFTDYNLKALHSAVTIGLSGKDIDRELTLSNWGTVDEPFTAYYGQISAYDLALLWKDYRKKLFLDNIRSFIGTSEINDQISKTIQNEPHMFIYFNNGVTLLANKIEPLPAKTVGKTTGMFACSGISIVNGAQTVGCLGNLVDNYPEQVQKCKVFIRLVPLENAPNEFGNHITVAANTQNRIEKRDFVSLDIVQANLKTELGLAGINYHYKRSEDGFVSDLKNCSLEEATIALACLQQDVTYSVFAKREIGVFWESIEKEPYKLLFNERLNPNTLWKAVQIYRKCMNFLAEQKDAKNSRDSSFYVFGNYLILNIVFENIRKDQIYNPTYSYSDIEKNNINSIIEEVVTNVYVASEDLYPTALMHQLYKNFTKCKNIKDKVMSIMNPII
jgi:hypothetical protein